MFKKIRKRIMLLNMLMVSTVVLVVFAVIFITSYTRVQQENDMKLMYSAPFHSQMSFSRRFSTTDNNIEGSVEIHTDYGLFEGIRFVPGLMSPDAGVSFSILVDSDANLLIIDSWIDMSYEAIVYVAEFAVNNSNRKETVSVEGRTWRFAVSPVNIIPGLIFGSFNDDVSGSESTDINESPDIIHIRFLDVTESHHMLRSLALTLAGASLVVLTVFFFISLYFAKQAVKPMEAAWEKQRRFITDASHELKTPLSVINANCGVLYANKDEVLENQIKWVESITRATDRMTGLVGSLLSLASIEDKQLVLQTGLFDLSEELTTSVNELESIALEKEITIIKDIEPETTIENDKDQVQKIITTLLENAVKYTPIKGEIIITLKKEKRRTICTIRNTGEGIPPEDLPNIFDRFYRGDPARSSENTGYGLGLSIAKATADQLKIKLSAESTINDYTEFTLSM